MSSEASSKQSCVREGAGYNEVYPSGQDDPGASYSERVPSANSPFDEEDEDLDVDESESKTNEDSDYEENVESPIRSIIGPNGLRKFVLPLMWTVNDLTRPLKENIFTPYGRDIIFPSTSPSIYPLGLKSAITMVLMTSWCMSNCSRQDLDSL